MIRVKGLVSYCYGFMSLDMLFWEKRRKSVVMEWWWFIWFVVVDVVELVFVGVVS